MYSSSGPDSKYHTFVLCILGLGNYQLLTQFKAAARSSDEICLITCHSPQKIVEKIRERNISSTKFTKESDNGNLCLAKEQLLIFYNIDVKVTEETPSVSSYAESQGNDLLHVSVIPLVHDSRKYTKG